MNNTLGTKLLSCTMGASIALAGTGLAAPLVAMADEAPAPVEVVQRDAVEYATIPNVNGTFSFSQDVLTPGDDVFNLFGTATTTLCAKPGYAFDEVSHECYYLNVGGDVKKVYTVGLDQIEQMDSETQQMRCTCGMSPAIAMAQVQGVRVSDILSMTEVAPEANTITFKDKDGYGLPLPLSYVTDKDALLVYQVGGQPFSDGERLQVWIPDTVAKYFTRAVTDIELSTQEVLPEVEGPDADQRAKVSVMNTVRDTFKVGDQISFEGYADDCGTQVTAVEFSLDGGQTWTSFDTSSSDTESWVYWNFDYVAEQPGTFKLDVRAVTEDGTVSPLASSTVFEVEE
ncbi:MAG: molybdopterin-dependent oxidoreductase [Coriobacteriia bacterium]|nr:molybdopterin-dependent oxidoreductase [Coriobacteriia bacterium]MBS5479030.1 molybdopterin-dependent oxidoreductase [Coriobacteriia bacterium]